MDEQWLTSIISGVVLRKLLRGTGYGAGVVGKVL